VTANLKYDISVQEKFSYDPTKQPGDSDETDYNVIFMQLLLYTFLHLQRFYGQI